MNLNSFTFRQPINRLTREKRRRASRGILLYPGSDRAFAHALGTHVQVVQEVLELSIAHASVVSMWMRGRGTKRRQIGGGVREIKNEVSTCMFHSMDGFRV